MRKRLIIENCALEFDFECPLEWSKLKATDSAGIKFCSECKNNVYRCESLEEINKHIDQGHCIAVKDDGDRMPMGFIQPPVIDMEELEKAGSKICKHCGDVVMYCKCYEDVIDETEKNK